MGGWVVWIGIGIGIDRGRGERERERERGERYVGGGRFTGKARVGSTVVRAALGPGWGRESRVTGEEGNRQGRGGSNEGLTSQTTIIHPLTSLPTTPILLPTTLQPHTTYHTPYHTPHTYHTTPPAPTRTYMYSSRSTASHVLPPNARPG